MFDKATCIDPQHKWLLILENSKTGQVEVLSSLTGYEARTRALKLGVPGEAIEMYPKPKWETARALVARAWRHLVAEDAAPPPPPPPPGAPGPGRNKKVG